jgi:carbonic anhydrase
MAPHTQQQLGSTSYNFKALHVHRLAEHAIGPNAALPDAELHLVHFNAANPNDLLVIGIHLRAKSTSLLGSVLDLLAAITGLPLYSSSQCSSALAAIFGKIAAATGGPAFTGSNNALLNLYDLVPRAAYFTYPGSLTTPPCSETVTWIVAQQLVRITPEQLQLYRDSVDRVPGSLASAEGFNNRPLQGLNGRVVRTCQF